MNNILAKIFVIMIAAFGTSVIYFNEWLDPGFSTLYDHARDGADSDYVTSLSCPDNLAWFNYCRYQLFDEKKPMLVVIGDSMGLAISEYFISTSVNHIYLGAGSCPMLLNLVVEYSNGKCADQLNYFYEEAIDKLSQEFENLAFVLVHSAAYIQSVGELNYKSTLDSTISLLKLRTTYPLALIEPVERPSRRMAYCLPRRVLDASTCDLALRQEQILQLDIIEELDLYRIKPSSLKATMHLIEYKDDLHLTMFGVHRYYEESINKWLSQIKSSS